MDIEMNPTGLTLSDLICVAHRKRSEDTGFPYAVQSCRCSNCRYVRLLEQPQTRRTSRLEIIATQTFLFDSNLHLQTVFPIRIKNQHHQYVKGSLNKMLKIQSSKNKQAKTAQIP